MRIKGIAIVMMVLLHGSHDLYCGAGDCSVHLHGNVAFYTL